MIEPKIDSRGVKNAIFLENIEPSDVDIVLLYYGNKNKTGGGDIKTHNYNEESGTLIICYQDENTVNNVLKFDEVKIGKKIYKPRFYENNSKL